MGLRTVMMTLDKSAYHKKPQKPLTKEQCLFTASDVFAHVRIEAIRTLKNDIRLRCWPDNRPVTPSQITAA